MITNISDLKHGQAILGIFEMMAGPNASPSDKVEIAEHLLEVTGVTIEQLDKDLETGVQNGHSVEKQLMLVQQVINLANQIDKDK